jgi:quinoprotein glucose dehydrogenase
MGTIDARLIELDAKTGEPCAGFGENGTVDLAAGIGDAALGEYGVTSPPVIVQGRIVTGAMVLDSRRVDAPGGVVRAYDVRTGALAWAWDPVLPDQAELAPRGEGVLYRRGTTNAWSALSTDLERGLVYVPTGNTSPDYYGGHRNGADYYSSSIVALDAKDGHVAWHFQTVHHDIWDYDVASQPVLFDFHGAAGDQPGLIAPTKLGMLFFLNRETGAPLFPVEERPVPQQGAVRFSRRRSRSPRSRSRCIRSPSVPKTRSDSRPTTRRNAAMRSKRCTTTASTRRRASRARSSTPATSAA